MAVLEGREPIVNTPPYVSHHPKAVSATQCFLLEEHTQLVRGYTRLPGQKELLKCHQLMKAWRGCVEPWAWKDTVCISYYEDIMMSNYLGIPQIYTPWYSACLCYPCFSVHPPHHSDDLKCLGVSVHPAWLSPSYYCWISALPVHTSLHLTEWRGGDRWIVSLQHLPGPLRKAHLFTFI